ncbi:sensor histidine kinase [Paenibacillus humicola]|uniref:sensor histidine kinase n=1 Tax=Paenibacillus humicola TaxID=3110540 RepID=UPI00237B28A3|nr:HAMP domain-containing sensor histidine kinase [Paenibacillus humicola]
MIRRRGVTYKIFMVTTLLLVVSALLIYLTLYFVLPGYYKSIKQSRLDSGVSRLVSSIEDKPFSDAVAKMLEFGQANNAVLFLRDADGGVFPVNFARYAGRIVGDGGYPGFRKFLKQPGQIPVDRDGLGRRIYTVSRTIHFNESTEPFTLYVDAPLQPIDEAREVILRFLPYMLIAILLIATAGAAIYSRLIARPLLGLNVVARRLAKLDFTDAVKPLRSNDEIGELSQSLSKLAANLRSTMAELQDANAQLKDDIEREREQEAKRREFVATISHELKTPITAVSGQLEAMIGNIGAFRDRDTYLRKSYKIMKDMEKLVHEILDLSKLESRDFHPLMREVDLAELVRESIDNVSFLAETKGIQIECDLPGEALTIADERLMAKAIANIVGNAVQYSGEGDRVIIRLVGESDAAASQLTGAEAGNAAEGGNAGAAAPDGPPESRRAAGGETGNQPRPEARTGFGSGGAEAASPRTDEKADLAENAIFPPGSAGPVPALQSSGQGGRFRLEVLNTGAHLDEAKLPRLFEPFFRLEQSRSRATGGSGLGLYIVSKVLDAHCAEYGIENTPDGVKFSVVLAAA